MERYCVSGWSNRPSRDLSGNGETGESRCIACHKRGRIEQRHNRIESSIVLSRMYARMYRAFDFAVISLVRLRYELSLFPGYRNAGFAFWE